MNDTLGYTMVFGILQLINFAHGALLTAAMFAAFFAHKTLGLDPYIAAVGLTPLFFLVGYALQRFVIGPAAHGEDRNILLVTLGLALVYGILRILRRFGRVRLAMPSWDG